MADLWTVFRRELAGYFVTPLAPVFVIAFLVLAGVLTIHAGGLFERGQADLQPFFGLLPWLSLVLVPALTMRLWAEERRVGTVELLLTLPVSETRVVLAKFLAAWALALGALALTFPLWLTVNVLGDPDNGVILAGYVGAGLMLGLYLALGAALSVLTRNQVIAFVAAAGAGFLLTVAGAPIVLDVLRAWAPGAVVDAVAALGVLRHYLPMARGILDLADMFYFVSMIGLFLFANVVFLDLRRAEGP